MSKVANDIDGRLTNFWYAPEVGIVMIDRIRLGKDERGTADLSVTEDRGKWTNS